jgi:hypothetical protein
MTWIVCQHRKISVDRHFQNGHHNTAKIQHCSIRISNVVEIGQCWICTVLWWPFLKWRPVEIFQCRQSIRDIIIYVGRLWCPEMIPDIEKFLPATIFKMATTIPHKFNIVRFQRHELIPDKEIFLPVSIFKMATTIPQKFNIVRFQR